MKSLLLALSCFALLGPAHAASDADVDAHRGALDLAGAFSNDGFKIRDGNFTGTLKKGETKLVQVNLYAGNSYWFSVATAAPETKVSLSLYDEAGKLLKTEPYDDATRSAAGFSPDASGPFYMQVRGESDAPASFCLIYSYK